MGTIFPPSRHKSRYNSISSTIPSSSTETAPLKYNKFEHYREQIRCIHVFFTALHSTLTAHHNPHSAVGMTPPPITPHNHKPSMTYTDHRQQNMKLTIQQISPYFPPHISEGQSTKSKCSQVGGLRWAPKCLFGLVFAERAERWCGKGCGNWCCCRRYGR